MNPSDAALSKSRASNRAVVPPSRRLDKVLCLDDFEALAKKKLPRPLFGYISGAAEDNLRLTTTVTSLMNTAFCRVS
jgi:L-lactate dehydrogenase (cytochrome)